jgi:hypothetical protein
MKKTDIQINKKYTDNKGNVREVIGVGSDFKLYNTQQNDDCVRYRVVAKKKGPNMIGDCCNSTRISFANWAKTEVA